jgi:hypothetical protein
MLVGESAWGQEVAEASIAQMRYQQLSVWIAEYPVPEVMDTFHPTVKSD